MSTGLRQVSLEMNVCVNQNAHLKGKYIYRRNISTSCNVNILSAASSTVSVYGQQYCCLSTLWN